MNNERTDMQNLLPPAPIDYQILLTLIGRSRHGYEIKKIVEKEMGTDILVLKVYCHLRKLTDDGLVEIDERATVSADDPRRRYYKITGEGQEVFKRETYRLAEVIENAQGLLIDKSIKGYTRFKIRTVV